MRRKARFQAGSVQLDKRTQQWWFRWRENGQRRAELIGTLQKYPTKARAQIAAEPFRSKVVGLSRAPNLTNMTVNEVARRYIAEELPSRFSTRQMYLCNLKNHVLPKWGEFEIAALQPAKIEQWLKGLALAPKTKVHLRSMIRLLFESAMRNGYIEIARNPVDLVRIAGSKRKRGRRTITVQEFEQVLSHITVEPHRTMILLALFLGLRQCEVAGLKWEDIDWVGDVIHVRRSVVSGKPEKDAKTDRSMAPMPMDPAVAELLKAWHNQTEFKKPTDWMFASPFTSGELPYLAKGIQQRYIRPAMDKVGLEKGMGWHTFRHTYRTLLSVAGTSQEVARDLMRHASIVTTFDTYGDALSTPMRVANSKVVEMIRKPA